MRSEWKLGIPALTALLFLIFGKAWLADLSAPGWFAFVSAWLFVAIMLSAFGVVRHADALAIRLGEPYGTLILTVSVISIEVLMISAVMITGADNPTLARDTMYAVIMIVLNGLIGLSLLLGGLRHRELRFNLQGANSFLAVILPLAVFGLVLPNFTRSTPDPTLSTPQEIFLVFMSLALYAIFLGIQTIRHRAYFMTPDESIAGASAAEGHPEIVARSIPFHALFVLAYLIPVVVLAKKLAVPLDYGIARLGAPAALGGFVVAALVLSPEALAGIRAAVANKPQRSVNIYLGSVLATIGLTIPAVLVIGIFTGTEVVLGLDGVEMLLLLLTLVLSILTLGSGRTNVLTGAVHFLIFVAYVVLLFD